MWQLPVEFLVVAQTVLRFLWLEKQVPRTRKISTRQFARKFADIAEQTLSKLPAQEQERRIAAFERAVSKTSRDVDST